MLADVSRLKVKLRYKLKITFKLNIKTLILNYTYRKSYCSLVKFEGKVNTVMA